MARHLDDGGPVSTDDLERDLLELRVESRRNDEDLRDRLHRLETDLEPILRHLAAAEQRITKLEQAAGR